MDAESYEIAATPVDITPLSESLVPAMLRSIGMDEFAHTALPPADSKHFLVDGGGLHLLLGAIKKSDMPVLVTHGTDALGITAVAVYEALKVAGSERLVVFSCAMTPLSNTLQADGSYQFTQCDGTKNTQRALKEMKNLSGKTGVYVAANEGEFFEGNEKLSRIRKEFDAPSPDKRFFFLKP